MHNKIITHLTNQDAILGDVIQKLPQTDDLLIQMKPPTTFFENLADSIVGQQLSTKAADTIWARVKALAENQLITPEFFLHTPNEIFRSVGVSGAKTKYLKNLADHIANGELDLLSLPRMTDEEVILQLTKVKGIGRWTAEMFLIFNLGREDVFSMGDLGLRNAVKRWYSTSDKPTSTELEPITEKWAPYRSYAARILWQSLELPKE
jgi:DNA-3-methyladenine glycosylase II